MVLYCQKMITDSSLNFFWTDSKRLFRGSQSNMTEEKWHWKICHFLNLFCPLCASGTTRSPILIINIRWDKKKIVLQYNAHRACYHLLSYTSMYLSNYNHFQDIWKVEKPTQSWNLETKQASLGTKSVEVTNFWDELSN